MTRTLRVLIAATVILVLVFMVAGTTRASEEPQVVRVTLKDYQIGLSQFTVAPGKAVKFILANQGELSHQVVIQPWSDASMANGIESPVIGSHTSQEVQFTLAPGVYRISCVQWDHADRGMVNVVAADTVHPMTIPVQMDFVIPLLALVLGSAYIIGDSMGLRLTRQ